MDEKHFATLLALSPQATDEQIKTACQDVPIDSLRELHEELLAAQAKASQDDAAAVQEIMDHAQADHAFGNLPPCMGDYYDNEVRAISRGGPADDQFRNRIAIVTRAVALMG